MTRRTAICTMPAVAARIDADFSGVLLKMAVPIGLQACSQFSSMSTGV